MFEVIKVLYIIVFICFIIIFTFFYGAMLILNKSKLTIGNRIKQVKNIDTDDISEIDRRSFSQRALMPFYQEIILFMIKATPNRNILQLKKKFTPVKKNFLSAGSVFL